MLPSDILYAWNRIGRFHIYHICDTMTITFAEMPYNKLERILLSFYNNARNKRRYAEKRAELTAYSHRTTFGGLRSEMAMQ